jgi:hypothetical protein
MRRGFSCQGRAKVDRAPIGPNLKSTGCDLEIVGGSLCESYESSCNHPRGGRKGGFKFAIAANILLLSSPP